MSPIAAGLLAAVVAYFAGSLPFGYLTARFVAGIDIRREGSGNIGATNVARVLGSKYGIFVLFLDCLKGLLPVLLLPELFATLAQGETGGGEVAHVRVACGIMTIIGHMFPCWLRFRGGKGVATALGVVLVISWQATLAAFGTFALVFALTRIVSLCSMLASVTFAAAQMWLLRPEPFSEANWSTAAFSLLVPLLIMLRHYTNLARLVRGEEPKFSTKSGQAETGSSG